VFSIWSLEVAPSVANGFFSSSDRSSATILRFTASLCARETTQSKETASLKTRIRQEKKQNSTGT
jgi:hypothetical protein